MDMEIYGNLMQSPIEDSLTSLQGDSPVSLTVPQVKDEVVTMKEPYGLKWIESSKRYNPLSLWQRMFAESFLLRTDWYSRISVLTLKGKTTRFNRTLFQLVPLMHPHRRYRLFIVANKKGCDAQIWDKSLYTNTHSIGQKEPRCQFPTNWNRQFDENDSATRFGNWFEAASALCRVGNGIPKRLDKYQSDRIEAMGDSVVPQVAYQVFQSIIQSFNQ